MLCNVTGTQFLHSGSLQSLSIAAGLIFSAKYNHFVYFLMSIGSYISCLARRL
jgi:hypothetical protein